MTWTAAPGEADNETEIAVTQTLFSDGLPVKYYEEQLFTLYLGMPVVRSFDVKKVRSTDFIYTAFDAVHTL